MESAFGIDHGEVSKAFGMGGVSRIGTKIGLGAGQAGRGLQRAGAGMAGKPGMLKPKLGQGMQGAGRGMRQAGVGMARNPMKTGVAAAGVGGAGVGAGTAGLMNRRRTY